MVMDPSILDTLTQQALAIARQAGERIVEVYHGEFEVAIKDDQTPVTTADMAAHEIIVDGLSALEPAFPVLSEESGEVPYTERHEWACHWLVDPLDGTREFLRRNGEFSVNIALVADNRPLLGVIVAPVLGIAYYASRGQGAYKQRGSEAAVPIHVRDAPAGDALVVARSHNRDIGPRMRRFLDRLGGYREINMGSALKSCLVAEGRADVYMRFGPTGEWDTAAAQCIVEEAGGQITDTRMCHLRYNTRESLINPHFLVVGDSRRDWSDYLQVDMA